MRRLARPGAFAVAAALVLSGAFVRAGAAEAEPFRAGFAVRSILPDPSSYPDLWHVSRRQPTGVLPGDGLWARAAFLDDGTTRVGIVSLDLLGFFYDDILLVRDRVRRELGDDVQVIVASTHTHSSIDTLGIYGPNAVSTGVNAAYQQMVRETAAQAVIDAAAAAVPATAAFASRPAPAGLNEFDENRHDGSFDDDVHVMSFRGASGPVGTIVNWASHPELIDPKSRTDPGIPDAIRGSVISSDYVHTLRTTVEEGGGGPVVFLNGPVGAVTGLAMPVRDPATGETLPRRSVRKAQVVGRAVGETALAALAGPGAVRVERPSLTARSEVFDLRVDNPFILALKAARTVDRRTYLAGLEVPLGRDVRTEMVRVTLGPAELMTVPGELFPDLYTGVYLPREERANPDVPRERPIRDQMTGSPRFLVGLGMDELGYFRSATDYVPPSTVSPIYGEGIDRNGRSHYQETLSLGRDTARSISQVASRLLGQEPEADYLPYPGGFLDAAGRPLYGSASGDVRGIWADTTDSGRYEQRGDTEVFSPLPVTVPAGFGYLDARLRDMGTSFSTAVRGAWIDGDGDGSFDPLRDPHLMFSSYHVGPGELEGP